MLTTDRMSVEKVGEHSLSFLDHTEGDPRENSVTLPEQIYEDEEAFEVLRKVIMRFIRSTVGSGTFSREDVEDLCQITFEKAWTHRASFAREKGTFDTWLFQIAHNTVIDALRSKKRRAQTESRQWQNNLLYKPGNNLEHDTTLVDEQPSDEPTPEEIVIQHEEVDSLHRALRVLPSHQREAIELNFFSEFTHKEIAQNIKEPLGTVKTRIRQGLIKLRNSLAEPTKGND